MLLAAKQTMVYFCSKRKRYCNITPLKQFILYINKI